MSHALESVKKVALKQYEEKDIEWTYEAICECGTRWYGPEQRVIDKHTWHQEANQRPDWDEALKVWEE